MATPVITNKGTSFYAALTGQGVKSYNGDKMQYKCPLVLSKEDAQELVQQIQEEYDTYHKQGLKLQSLGFCECNAEGYQKTEEGVPLTSEECTHFRFNFNTNTHFPDGSKVNLSLQDAQARVIDRATFQLGNGSVVRVGGNIQYYSKGSQDGVRLNLKGVQIIKLVRYDGGTDFSAYKEEGYSADEEDDVPANFDSLVGTSQKQSEELPSPPRKKVGRPPKNTGQNQTHPQSVDAYAREAKNTSDFNDDIPF